MSNRYENNPNRLKRSVRVLAAAGGIAVGSFFGISEARTAALKQNTLLEAPATSPKVSTAIEKSALPEAKTWEAKLNARIASFSRNFALAARTEGPAKIVTSVVSLTPSKNGRRSTITTTQFGTPGRYGDGGYRVSVVAPAVGQGAPDYNRISSVSIAMGNQTNLSFMKIRNNWSFRGDYMPKNGVGLTTIQASVDPTLNNEATLTPQRANATMNQARAVLGRAQYDRPLTTMAPAFVQPAGSVINPLK